MTKIKKLYRGMSFAQLVGTLIGGYCVLSFLFTLCGMMGQAGFLDLSSWVNAFAS